MNNVMESDTTHGMAIQDTTGDNQIVIIACSIFRDALEELRREKIVSEEVTYIDSSLHMYPAKLHEAMYPVVAKLRKEGKKIALIYGDCHAHMCDYCKDKCVDKVNGINCIEMFLGRPLYRKLRKEGAFFLMPEWTERWHEIFEKELGLTGKTAKEFLKEMHTKLIYIDSGYKTVPTATLEEIHKYSGLPVEVLKTDLSKFKENIKEVLDELKGSL